MGRAERVVDVGVGEFARAPRRTRVVGLLARVEPQVLSITMSRRAEVVRPRRSTSRLVQACRRPGAAASGRPDGRRGAARPRPRLWAGRGATREPASHPLRELVDRRHDGADPAVVGDRAVVGNGTLRSRGGRRGAGEVARGSRACEAVTGYSEPTRRARPDRRAGSSSPTRCRTTRSILTVRPITIVDARRTCTRPAMPTMSEDTIGSSV